MDPTVKLPARWETSNTSMTFGVFVKDSASLRATIFFLSLKNRISTFFWARSRSFRFSPCFGTVTRTRFPLTWERNSTRDSSSSSAKISSSGGLFSE